MSETMMLSRIFGLQVGETKGKLERTAQWKFHDFYSSPNVTTLIGSRLIRMAEHLARIQISGMRTGFGFKTLNE